MLWLWNKLASPRFARKQRHCFETTLNMRLWRYHSADCGVARKICHLVAMNSADDSSHASDASVGIE
jgi:hypothetical protein